MGDTWDIVLLIVKIISAIVSLLLGSVALYYADKSGYWDDLKKYSSYRKLPERNSLQNNDRVYNDWINIKARLEIGDEANLKLALIEADKLIDNVLKKMGYTGNSMIDRLKLLEKSNIEGMDGLWNAHKVRNRIVHDNSYNLTPEESIRIIKSYETILHNLNLL